VLLQDPFSRTSPPEILPRWNESHLPIEIWLWQDEDYFLKPFHFKTLNRLAANHTQEADHMLLKRRQKEFAVACKQVFQAAFPRTGEVSRQGKQYYFMGWTFRCRRVRGAESSSLMGRDESS